MSFWNKLFGKTTIGKSQPKSYKEKDNRGTRNDTESIADAYWTARTFSSKKEPFVLYTFDTEEDAHEALLELPCIHVVADSGRLICTDVLMFGCYATKDGKYEAVICEDMI
jgi:hypothetical protein